MNTSTRRFTSLLANEETAPGGTDEGPSFAVCTRVIAQELPYVLSFVKHYARLGVRKFYFLSNRKQDIPRVRRYLHEHAVPGVSLVFEFRSGGADDILADPKLLEGVAEDYIVGVDLDEYWSLPAGVETLQQLAAKDPADAWMARWAIVASDEMAFKLKPPYSAYMLEKGKWIAKRSALQSLVGIHVPVLKPGEHRVRNDTGVLVHFYSRGFKDAVGKGLAQFFRDGTVFNQTSDASGHFHGCEGLKDTLKILREGGLPERLQTLTLMTLHPRPLPIASKRELLTVDARLQDRVLDELVAGSSTSRRALLRRLHERYAKFKECVQARVAAQPEHLDLIPANAAKWLLTLPC